MHRKMKELDYDGRAVLSSQQEDRIIKNSSEPKFHNPLTDEITDHSHKMF